MPAPGQPVWSPGLEDDFAHLGMITDLLDDSPGGALGGMGMF